MLNRVVLWVGLALATPLAFAEPSPSCVQVSDADSALVFENGCNEPVSIAYCSLGQPIWGERCGDNKSASNPYYTHMFQLKTGEQRRMNRPQLRYAICGGYMNNWSGLEDKFHSAADGSFSCWPNDRPGAKPAAPEDPRRYIRATGTGVHKTCANAQSIVKEAGGKAPPCHCSQIRRTDKVTVHTCEVEVNPEAFAPGLQQRLKAALRQWCEENPECTKKNHSSRASGIRG